MKRILFLFALITSVLVFTGCEDDKCLNAPECINGECNPETGECECAPGFIGENCELPFCDPGVCQGECDPVTGECLCSGNFTGENCSECLEGWTGADCDVLVCDDANCGDNGVCDSNGTCSCINGYIGEFCDCNGNNATITYDIYGVPTCTCNEGWTGANCDILVCDDADCGDNGNCDSNGNCECTNGYIGEFCDCNGNNATITFDVYGIPSCTCNDGWTGDDCNTPIVTTGNFVGTWDVVGDCVLDSVSTYPIYYTATIFEDSNTGQTIVSNFGAWGESPEGVVIGNDIQIGTYVVYATDYNGNQTETFVSGSGVLNAAQDQIIFQQIADATTSFIVCTETWTLQP